MWKNWLDIAKQDYIAAENLLEDGLYPESAFYSQQASEKALKAVNIKENKENIKGHSIVSLAKALNCPQKIISATQELTTHYVSSRYPDIVEDILDYYDYDLTKKLLNYSKEVLEWSIQKLEPSQKK